MASEVRKFDDDLKARLAREGVKFGFFQAVKLLHRLYPDARPVGELGPPREEAVRFVHDPRLIFHSSDISEIRPRVVTYGHAHAEVTTTFMGLNGSASPLANYISEDLLWADENEQATLKAFYDFFHHRLLSLFYRAWKKYRFDATFRTDASDPFTRRVFSFAGIDTNATRPNAQNRLHALLPLASLIAQRLRTPHSLEVTLRHLFPGVPTRVESFTERRVRLAPEQRVQLGVQNCSLGRDFALGSDMIDRAGRFRICIGPVRYDVYESLMPGGSRYAQLLHHVKQYSGGVLEGEVEVGLGRDESPRFQIGSKRGARLGVNTRLAPKGADPLRVAVVLSDKQEEAKPRVVE